MFLFYVLSFFKKGDTIQGGTFFKGGNYIRKYGAYFKTFNYCIRIDRFYKISSHQIWMCKHKVFPTLYPFVFLFQVLYNQFKFFLNFFFLLMACSQFIPELRIGYLYTYWVPLGFVISVSLIREAVDDIRRYQRDCEVNSSR